MDALGEQGRILVVARPNTGRVLTALLSQVGYEAHRTPGGASLPDLIQRLRPALAVVALEPSWFDGEQVVATLRDARHPFPVLVVGDSDGISADHHVAQLPGEAGPLAFLDAVHHLLSR